MLGFLIASGKYMIDPNQALRKQVKPIACLHLILKLRLLLNDDVQDGVVGQPGLNLYARKEPKASLTEIPFCFCHFDTIDCWVLIPTEKMGTFLFFLTKSGSVELVY
ncbi:hypothetical protein SLA2020_052320 [Shorea laevis]